MPAGAPIELPEDVIETEIDIFDNTIFELEDVRRVHVQSFINYLSELGRKETYVNSILKSIRSLFHYCEEEEYIKESPVRKGKFQKEEITAIRTFNDDEVKRMVNYYSGKKFLDQRNKLIMTIYYSR